MNDSRVTPYIEKQVLNCYLFQDYYCDLSPVQQLLYEDFSKSELQKNTVDAISTKQSCNTFSMFQVC